MIMKKLFLILFLSSFAYFIIACNSEDSNDNKAGSEKGYHLPSDIRSKKLPAESTPNPDIQLISQDTLELLLPTNIPGAEKFPSNIGSQNYGGRMWNSASAEYAIDNGILIIQINDYGSSANMPEDEYRLFTFLPKSDNMQSERVWYKDGKGYFMWNAEKGEGKLQVLYNDRFVVSIDAYKLGKHDAGMMQYLKKIDVEKFNSLVN